MIIDKEVCSNKDLVKLAIQLKAARVGVVQLRDKISSLKAVLEQSRELSRIFSGSETLFIVNDYADIARQAGADGVHIGQSDCGLRQARGLLGSEAIVGVSCSSLEQAIAAEDQGADYLGIGPVFPTGTKQCSSFCDPGLFTLMQERVKLPFFVIGGINLANLPVLRAVGVEKVAVCSAVCSAFDPKEAAQRFIVALGNKDK